MIIASAAIICSCAGGKNNEAKIPAINLANFDTTVSLKNDFYQYATGGWQKNTPLKDEYARYGAFDVLRENNEYRIKELFAGLATQTNESGSVGQKISDLYNMGLDSTTLNKQGVSPIAKDLELVDSIKDKASLSAVLGTIHEQINSPFFGMYVSVDEKNAQSNILNVSQSGLGMGSRDYYLNKENAPIKEAYTAFVKDLFSLAGYSKADAERATNSVMQIENSIAEASTSNVDLRDPYANYNMLTIGEFKSKYNAIDWDVYAATMGLSLPESINVGQLKQMAEVNKLISTLDTQVVKDYLAYNVIKGASSYLNDEIGKLSFNFFGKTMQGVAAQQPRWKRALAVANGSLSEAVGEMYVAKYFPAEYKEKMLNMVHNLQAALSEHINNLEWMSAETKVKAQEKLSTFYVKVGYPDEWKDYSALTIDPALSYWENVKNISKWGNVENLSKLGKPVDKDEWHMSPQTVNAYYNPTTNEICFPAAILQPPFFNPDADDAVNYGAIGVVIGHEMTHGFDDQGRQYDKDGNLSDWWTAEDAKAFEAKAKVLVEQFNSIEVLPGVFANGQFTLGENIADQGGLRVSYTAMKKAQNGVEPAKIDNLNADERFYIGYATLWGQNVRDKEIARLTNVDPHSLGKYRVNQSLKNIDNFYKTFNITDGDMYLAPEKRVVIW